MVPFARLMPKPGRNISVITGNPVLATQKRNPSENPADPSAREVAEGFWPSPDHIVHPASSSFCTVPPNLCPAPDASFILYPAPRSCTPWLATSIPSLTVCTPHPVSSSLPHRLQPWRSLFSPLCCWIYGGLVGLCSHLQTWDGPGVLICSGSPWGSGLLPYWNCRRAEQRTGRQQDCSQHSAQRLGEPGRQCDPMPHSKPTQCPFPTEAATLCPVPALGLCSPCSS